MRSKRLWAMFWARNCEFFRDKAAFGWNFLFPFLIIGGFGIIFSGRDYQSFKVGVFPSPVEEVTALDNLPVQFSHGRQLKFIGFATFEEAEWKLIHHKVDFLVDTQSSPYRYWVNGSSPKGYVVERIFKASLLDEEDESKAVRAEIRGREIRYIDWLFPGILGMNMMFSSLWGVGYVVVRYRKNGVLKRLKATPLTAFEYLTAQMLSRIFLLMFTLIVIWLGSHLIFHFHVEGSYFLLFVVFLLGGVSLSSLGLVLAARGTSEEFTSGILNFISWPMMFLSEVWFSIEGAPRWLKNFSQILPLTHLNGAARRIMNDGAGFADVSIECAVLLVTTFACLILGAALFSWHK